MHLVDAAILEERQAVLLWIARYGDEVNRVIARSEEGPLRTSLMGEFSATVSIRQALEKGLHRG